MVAGDDGGTDRITVWAQVHLLSTLESGRRGSYRPNHNFFGPDGDVMAIGTIELRDGVELRPGETIELPITFWWGPELEGQIIAAASGVFKKDYS